MKNADELLGHYVVVHTETGHWCGCINGGRAGQLRADPIEPNTGELKPGTPAYLEYHAEVDRERVTLYPTLQDILGMPRSLRGLDR